MSGFEGLEERIKRYTLAPFSVNKGPRSALILDDLKKAGLYSRLDCYGNIWAEKGIGEKIMLVSSHMDTVFGLEPENYEIEFKEDDKGLSLKGTLDNSVGCAINVEVAKRVSPAYRTLFLFTVEEELDIIVLDRGAGKIVEALDAKGIKPEICIVLDVTFAKVPIISEDSTIYPGYAENFSSPEVKAEIEAFIKRNGISSVAARDFRFPDETYVYDSKFPTFALGPAVDEDLHSSDAETYINNIEATIEFLEKLLKGL